jgi:hypothetical protein
MRCFLAMVCLLVGVSVIAPSNACLAAGGDEAKANDGHALTNPALHDELLKMGTTDQEYRAILQNQFIKSPPKPGTPPSHEMLDLVRKQQQADAANIKRLEEIIHQHGWPGKSLVGEDASTSAFLIIQHAELKVQQKYLPMLKRAASEGEAKPDEVAMLEDRVLMREGKKQMYGTQLRAGPETGGKLALYPIEDEPNVDKRRASVGLGPIAEYVKQFNVDYHPPHATTAPAQSRPATQPSRR